MSRDELMARTRKLEALLAAREALLATREATLAAREATLAEQAAQIAELSLRVDEQKSLIAQLQRMLFGPKSEKMTEEQATELAAVVGDLTEQQQRPGADSDAVLEEEDTQEGSETQKQTSARRRRRAPQVPVNLEVETTVLEPTDPPCAECGQMGEEIGREVSEQVDLIPAKLIVRRTVRIKRKCRCGCGKIAIAPLPPQILPGSKLGLGLAVFILLSKYDDHRVPRATDRTMNSVCMRNCMTDEGSKAPRDRLTGAGLKSPLAAVVKSHCRERRRKRPGLWTGSDR